MQKNRKAKMKICTPTWFVFFQQETCFLYFFFFFTSFLYVSQEKMQRNTFICFSGTQIIILNTLLLYYKDTRDVHKTIVLKTIVQKTIVENVELSWKKHISSSSSAGHIFFPPLLLSVLFSCFSLMTHFLSLSTQYERMESSSTSHSF